MFFFTFHQDTYNLQVTYNLHSIKEWLYKTLVVAKMFRNNRNAFYSKRKKDQEGGTRKNKKKEQQNGLIRLAKKSKQRHLHVPHWLTMFFIIEILQHCCQTQTGQIIL